MVHGGAVGISVAMATSTVHIDLVMLPSVWLLRENSLFEGRFDYVFAYVVEIGQGQL